MKNEDKVVYAALDIGTSQVKLGAYCPYLSDRIIIINNLRNELIYGSSGEVQIDYQPLRKKLFQLLKELGSFLKRNNIATVYIGICGHVSSLIEWNREKGPPAKPFPIWLDTTSYDSLDEYNLLMGNGKSREIIGTFLPAGTNWLLTKLLHRKKAGFDPNSVFLQVSDAIFHELTGHFKTHFSSQISMVNLEKKEYAPEILEHLQLGPTSLPVIEYGPYPILNTHKSAFDLPAQSFVLPAMADLYTSLFGLRLQEKEGFMLANTSEQAGVFFLKKPGILNNFLSISFGDGFINYGSTNTGGNIVNWLLTTVLRREMTTQVLDELTTQAVALSPGDTPIILPYLQGERAPLWNSKLTASILQLQSSHTDIHLFRAVLESIAFARRQCFEDLDIDSLDLIKLSGGSSKNTLWNSIRASVLKKNVAVADEKELALAGMIYYIMETMDSRYERPAIHFSIIEPDPALTPIYNEKYREFIRYQKLLS